MGGGAPFSSEIVQTPLSPASGYSETPELGFRRNHYLALAAGLLFGGGLRLVLAASSANRLMFDESTVGLQASDFLRGHYSVFFPGQAYGGTLETFFVAISVHTFGRSQASLEVTPALFHLLAAVVLVMGARRALGPTPATAAAVALWIMTPAFYWVSLKERGFYGAAILLASLVVVLGLLLLQTSDGTEVDRKRSLRYACGLGLCTGVCLWTTPLLVAVVIPVTICAAVFRPRSEIKRLVLAGGAGVTLSLSPLIAWEIVHGWVSYKTPTTLGASYLDRLSDLVGLMRQVVGLSEPLTKRPIVALPSALTGPMAAGILVAIPIVLCRNSDNSQAWRVPPRRLALLFTVGVCGYLLIAAINPTTGGAGQDPRYLYPLAPLVAVGVGGAIASLPALGRLLVVALSCVLLVVGVASPISHPADIPGEYRAGNDLARAINKLEQMHVQGVYTEAVGYTVEYLATRPVLASTFAVVRRPSVERRVRRLSSSAYLLDNASALGNVDRLTGYLRGHAIQYTEWRFGRWSVVEPVGRVVAPESVPLLAFLSPVQRP